MKKLFVSFLVGLLSCGVSQAGLFSGAGAPDFSNNAGNSFFCANLAGTAVVTQAGLSKTSPALVLVNPMESGKNLVLLEVGVAATVLPPVQSNFMLAFSTGSTQNVVYYASNTITTSSLLYTVINSTTAQAALTKGQCYGGVGTLLPVNAPTAFRYIGSISTVTVSSIMDQTNGKVVIPPGGIVSIQSTAAASVLTHFLWREDNQ